MLRHTLYFVTLYGLLKFMIIVNSEDPAQTDQDLHCLFRLTCLHNLG